MSSATMASWFRKWCGRGRPNAAIEHGRLGTKMMKLDLVHRFQVVLAIVAQSCVLGRDESVCFAAADMWRLSRLIALHFVEIGLGSRKVGAGRKL